MRRLLVASTCGVLAAALSVAGGASWSPAAPASYPGFNGWIAYQSGGDVFIRDLDDGTTLNLTNHAADDGNPQWSPDGTKILFNSDRDGTQDIWMLDLAGKNPSTPTKVVGTDGLDYDPTWCGNNQVAFMSDYDADGDTDVADFEIWRQNLGAPPEQVTDNDVFDGYPNCSDQGVIAFHSTISTGNNDLFLYDPSAGVDPFPLFEAPGNQTFPSWYPDNSGLVYVDNTSGNGDIYKVNADGTGMTGLVMGPQNEWDPAVSPDGTTLALGINQAAGDDIYTLSIGGGEPIPFGTTMPSYSPDWQPVGDDTVIGHERTLTLEVAKKKPLKLRGDLDVLDGYGPCELKAKLKILAKAKKKQRYKKIGTVRTDDLGRYAFKVEDMDIPLPSPPTWFIKVVTPLHTIDAGPGKVSNLCSSTARELIIKK